MNDIAAHAGLGNGTLYRNFTDKEALLMEMCRERFEELYEIASHAEKIDDPYLAIDTALRNALTAAKDDAGFQFAMMRSNDLHWEGIEEQKAALAASFTRLLNRGQEAGSIRSDLVYDDIPMILTGIMSTMYFKPSPADWQRHLELVLAGLRP